MSRLHGHSSSSGALRVRGEVDCLEQFELKLKESGVLTDEGGRAVRQAAREEVAAAVEQALVEREPGPADVRSQTYAASPVDVIYPDDYTGLPQ